VDYKNALDYMFSLSDKDPLTVEMILDIHKILCRSDNHSLPGRFRNSSYGFSQKNAKYIFLKPEQIPNAMRKFVDQVNNELLATDNIAVWGKLAWLHYRFVYIHPFTDGNERMSSILVNWVLMKVCKSPLPVNLYESQQVSQLKYLSLNYVDARLLSKLYLQQIVHNYKQLFIAYRASLVSSGYDDVEGLRLDVQEDNYGEIDESYDFQEFIGTANSFIHTADTLRDFIEGMDTFYYHSTFYYRTNGGSDDPFNPTPTFVPPEPVYSPPSPVY
jgi:fido (protein-threonine AMPylation protein)